MATGYKVVDADLRSFHCRPWPPFQFEIGATQEAPYPGIFTEPTIEECDRWFGRPGSRIIELEYDPADNWTLGHRRCGEPDNRPAWIRRFRVVADVTKEMV